MVSPCFFPGDATRVPRRRSALQGLAMLSQLTEWDTFDVFALSTISVAPLGAIMMQLFTTHDLFARFRIDVAIYRRFAKRLESEYLNNPVCAERAGIGSCGVCAAGALRRPIDATDVV